MKLVLKALCLSAILAGCAPTVLQQSPKSVVIKHLDGSRGVSDALIEANKVCSTYGKTAIMDVSRCPEVCISQYICE